jgi:uncharacterized protein YjiS (DUF1127 family)
MTNAWRLPVLSPARWRHRRTLELLGDQVLKDIGLRRSDLRAEAQERGWLR